MRRILQILFGVIFVWMIVRTMRTSLRQSLWDACFGFITFYVWVAWQSMEALLRQRT
jgi:hypothetical protein